MTASDRFNRARRDAVRAAVIAASRAPGVMAAFVVVQTSDGYFTSGGQHEHGNAELVRLGALGVDHMIVQLRSGATGREHDEEDR